MNRQEYLEKLEGFGFPKSEYMILSGGSLLMRGLRRQTADFDLCVTEKLAEKLDLKSCPTDDKGCYVPFEDVQMTSGLEGRVFDIIDGYKCETLESLLQFKRRLMRPKDLPDIKAVEAYLAQADSRKELNLELQDGEWTYESVRRERLIVRAIVFDDEGYFYFVRVHRDDAFGKASLIETSGGGVEVGEKLEEAILRELNEELGAKAEILCKIGVVSDYYNMIGRHNINNYYLCRALSFGEKHLMPDEINDFHLSTLKLTYEEAAAEYERCRESKIGRLIANREIPVLKKAKEILRP